MLKNYIKIALKVMSRNKLFTFISLTGISLTLLVLVVLTSFFDYTFGPVEPETRLNRTLSVTFGLLETESGSNTMGPLFSPWFLKKYVKSLKTPETISMCSIFEPITVYRNKKKINMNIKYTDSEFWEIMDFKFVEGKPYNKKQVADHEHVVVISEKIKNEYFDGKDAFGKDIEINNKIFRVNGVVKSVSILRAIPYSDVWIPFVHTEEDLNKPCLTNQIPGWLGIMLARNKSDFPKIKKEFQNNMKQVKDPEGRFVKILTGASSYQEAIARQFFRSENGSMTPFMMIIYGLITLFLMLPAVNLVNINISRIRERSSEIGIRKSFGAASFTLIGQFIVENVVITLIGGLISLVLAAIIIFIFNQSNIIADTVFRINFRIFYTSIGFTLFFGLLSGVYPAFKMSKMQPVEALQGGER